MSMTDTKPPADPPESTGAKHPFHITKEEERQLRLQGAQAVPSLVIGQATSFDEYARQLMIPPAVMDLARKAEDLRLSAWEIEALRHHLAPGEPGRKMGLLRRILHAKQGDDVSHPPYIRVACSGRGHYDELATKHGHLDSKDLPEGDIGSPVVLEIWPAQHYSPIHSHGHTTGIVFCLAGQLDVMVYEHLDWNATKLGLLTLTPGQCAWLSKDTYAVHRVFCPMNGGDGTTGPGYMNSTDEFGASFHVYLNPEGTAVEHHDGDSNSRDSFDYIDEDGKDQRHFATHSDLSWSILRRVLANTPLT
ncbi:hypothetical protein CP981_01300 [Streptomyces platensis]|uniref:Cysteine dioxygenase n=1 Tax=Streptomyces platensis TaxID=58346 RepID=A0AAE6TKC3_STRPT|nr:hypothetical protein [Streptomyces platensis]OSY41665.1 hypothetical protein BG653_05028 [Streptomyces platensis]QEV50491.1 hypothetical protein CP981_01300 [Streptomyces platensis]